MASSSRKDSQAEIELLKSRVKELENQVTNYKRRLDELRKAKNTTVLKTQREVLEVNAPNLGQRNNDGKIDELQRRLSEQDRQRQQEVTDLKEKHRKEISELKSSKPETKIAACNHQEEIDRLHNHILTVEGAHAAAMLENQDLREKLETVTLQLSIKEAQWCEMEEQLTLKLKSQWSEKYREWMEKTEKKIEELQEANDLMRGYLKKQKPKD